MSDFDEDNGFGDDNGFDDPFAPDDFGSPDADPFEVDPFSLSRNPSCTSQASNPEPFRFDASSVGIGKKRETQEKNTYWVRTPDEVADWVTQVAEGKAKQHDLTVFQVKMLLEKYNFEPDLVTRKIEDSYDDIEALLAACATPYDDDEDGAAGDSMDVECPVCLSDLSADEMVSGLDCKHECCKECFRQYLYKACTDENGGLNRVLLLSLRCPQWKCECPIPLQMLKKYGGEKFLKKWKVWYAAELAQKADHFCQCVRPDCDQTLQFCKTPDEVEYMETETGELTCTCGYVLCWVCSGEACRENI